MPRATASEHRQPRLARAPYDVQANKQTSPYQHCGVILVPPGAMVYRGFIAQY